MTAAALTLAVACYCSELIQNLLINRKLLIMLLGCLPTQSKDYTFPWQDGRLTVKAELLLLQLVPTQRTPVCERQPFRVQGGDTRRRVMIIISPSSAELMGLRVCRHNLTVHACNKFLVSEVSSQINLHVRTE